MRPTPAPDRLPESRRNTLLRRVDWRFLLRQAKAPQAVDLARGSLSEAARLVWEGTGSDASSPADLVVLSHPSRSKLQRAHAALRPGGEVYCEWILPVPRGATLVRRLLERAGFEDIHLHWAWPLPGRAAPQFWIPLDPPHAAEHFLAHREASNRRQVALRAIWRTTTAAGSLAPLCAIARRPLAPGSEREVDDEIETVLAALPEETGGDAGRWSPSWLLLTGGHRSINKVVGLPFDRKPDRLVVKFARVADAEVALEHEAGALRTLEAAGAVVPGVPRVLAIGRRAGRLAVAETAIHGAPVLSTLTAATFPDRAAEVTEWLVKLAGTGLPQSRFDWWQRLVGESLDEFERGFASVAGRELVERARKRLEGLPDLPLVCEHRDCSPWNVVRTDDGQPALLDWESSEPSGLPGLDLIYFLANAAFIVEGSLDSGRTRQTYARLLDPTTPSGRVVAECAGEYCDRLGLSPDAFARLRLLCWIIHSRSEYRHLEMDAVAALEPETLSASVFLGLAEEELVRCEDPR